MMILEAIKIIVLSCQINAGNGDAFNEPHSLQFECQEERIQCFINKVAGHSPEIQVADALAKCIRD